MSRRWMTEREIKNKDNEVLSIVEIYAEGEKECVVRKENRGSGHHEKRLIIL